MAVYWPGVADDLFLVYKLVITLMYLVCFLFNNIVFAVTAKPHVPHRMEVA